jgi:hypothetical protein
MLFCFFFLLCDVVLDSMEFVGYVKCLCLSESGNLSLPLSPISCFGRQEQNKFESLINLWFLFFVLFSKILRFNGKENY